MQRATNIIMNTTSVLFIIFLVGVLANGNYPSFLLIKNKSGQVIMKIPPALNNIYYALIQIFQKNVKA